MGRAKAGWWRGAFSSSSQREWKEQTYGHDWAKQPVFPTYKAMPQELPADSAPAKASWAEPVEQDALGDLQSRLNAARKAENKVQRLTQARDKAQAQWHAFTDKMKETFLKEKQRFERDAQRLEVAIQAAMGEQDKARQAVRATVVGELPPAEDAAAPTAMIWEETTMAWEREEGSGIDGVLHRAMEGPAKAARQAGQTQLSPEILRMLAQVDAAAMRRGAAAALQAAGHPTMPPPGLGRTGPADMAVPGPASGTKMEIGQGMNLPTKPLDGLPPDWWEETMPGKQQGTVPPAAVPGPVGQPPGTAPYPRMGQHRRQGCQFAPSRTRSTRPCTTDPRS